jgi:hypothetical protein
MCSVKAVQLSNFRKCFQLRICLALHQAIGSHIKGKGDLLTQGGNRESLTILLYGSISLKYYLIYKRKKFMLDHPTIG